MAPDPMVDEEGVRRIIQEEQSRKLVQDKLDGIGKGVSDIKDTLNKILIAIVGLGGGTVGLRLVQTTPQQVLAGFIGGYLAFFSPAILVLRWRHVGNFLRLLLGVNVALGGSILAGLVLGPSPVISFLTTALLVLGLVLFPFFAWQMDRYVRKPKA